MRSEDVVHLPGADPARRALAAGFVLHELGEEPGDVHHADRLVHHDQAAGAHDRARFLDRVVVDRQVEVPRRDASARRPSHLRGLEVPPVRDPAADAVDDLAQGGSHRHLDEAGVVHLAGQREDLRPLAALGADPAVPVAALEDDQRDVRQRLDVVDVGRLALVAPHGGERRARARHPALALERGDQGRFLTADEGARCPGGSRCRNRIRMPRMSSPRSPASRACCTAMPE